MGATRHCHPRSWIQKKVAKHSVLFYYILFYYQSGVGGKEHSTLRAKFIRGHHRASVEGGILGVMGEVGSPSYLFIMNDHYYSSAVTEAIDMHRLRE